MIDLLNMDCMEYMATQQDNAFDLAIVDPPYGWGEQIKGRNKSGRTSWNIAPQQKYFNELMRVCKDQIIWGGNYFGLPAHRHFICWDKKQPIKNFARCEFAWSSLEKNADVFEYAYFGGTNADVTRFHPTQKPVKLYEWLLTNYANPGQRILDTHLGSGSSAIAAHYFGCDFVGMEIDKDYFDAAKERFDRETAQLSMFGAL